MDTYGSAGATDMTLSKLVRIFRELGALRLFVKFLSPNDNSKNQPYFGGDYSSLNIIPTGKVEVVESRSTKAGAVGKSIFRAPLNFAWVAPSGELHSAPDAKLILYPQYPEVRFSGFLRGSTVDIGLWMDPNKNGRAEGRVLVVGTTGDGRTLGYLVVPEVPLSGEIRSASANATAVGVFLELAMNDEKPDSRMVLLQRLREIHLDGWLPSKRLDSNGALIDCNSPNCGGYTLEALFGIRPNGYSEPDFMGWELKQFGVDDFARADSQIITLMTPEPTAGIYKDAGVAHFLKTFGYPDKNGKPDRLNFGGVHRVGHRVDSTGLTLRIQGFDEISGKITNPDGGIVLETDQGEIAAKWAFVGLLEHWKRKHEQAVYVPSKMRLEPSRSYHYGNVVTLGEQTDFSRLLAALSFGQIYYDPGIKMEGVSTPRPTVKRRSQFRIKSLNIGALYDRVSKINLLTDLHN